MRGLRLGAAIAVLATNAQSGGCVDQCSVHPPIYARVARSANAVVGPRWSHEIDPRFIPPARRGASDANLAAAGDTVVVADDGGLIALDATTGDERWRTAPSHLGVPALAGDAVVAADARRQTGEFDGARRAIVAFALRDGAPCWRIELPPLKPQPADPPYAGSPRYLPPVAVTSTADGVLASTTIDGSRPDEQDLLLTEIDARGEVRWRRVLGPGAVGRIVAVNRGIAYLATTEDGAILHDVVRLVRLGASGGFLGTIGYVVGPVAWDRNGDPIFENAFSIGSGSFAIESVGLAQFNGDEDARVVSTTWTYAPDGLPSNPGFGDAGIEQGYVYGLVYAGDENGAARLYRYLLAPPQAQRPLLLATGLRAWVAGPAHGWNVVEDDQGLVALRVRDDGREERLRLALYGTAASVDAAAFDGHRLYAARSDGRVQGFDLDRETTILDAPTRCAPDDTVDRQHAWRSIGVHGGRVIAVCARRVYAFAREKRSARGRD